MDSDIYKVGEGKSEKKNFALIWEYTEISTPLECVI